MNNLYPTTLNDIGVWAKSNRLPVEEARFRFAQYGVLRAIADSRRLSQTLVFKGGNALDFIWQPNRSTRDLDFSAKVFIEGSQLQTLLTGGLQVASRKTGTAYRVQRLDRQPPAPESTFITYMVNVGYAFSSDHRNRDRIEKGMPVSNVVPLDVSLNEPICSCVNVDIAGTHPLLVSSVEDIVAEKLRALLQQPLRNRQRRQDLLDIAFLMRKETNLELGQISKFLLSKAQARHVPVSRAAFRHEEIRRRAEMDYNGLQQTTRTAFIPFSEAYETVIALVAQLEIPET